MYDLSLAKYVGSEPKLPLTFIGPSLIAGLKNLDAYGQFTGI